MFDEEQSAQPTSDDRRPWEQLPGETARQFAWFREYRDRGSERSGSPGLRRLRRRTKEGGRVRAERALKVLER